MNTLFVGTNYQANLATYRNKASSFLQFDCTKTKANVILASLAQPSLLDEHQTICLTQANFLSSQNNTDLTGEELLSLLNESTTLLVQVDKLDARKKITKQFKQQFKVVQCDPLTNEGIREFVKEGLKQRKITLTDKQINWLVQVLPLDELLIQQELDKLAVYPDQLTNEVLLKLIHPERGQTIFLMVDALLEARYMIALGISRQLNEPFQMTLRSLSSLLRFMAQVAACDQMGLSQDQIVQQLKAHPYRVSQSLQKSRHYGFDHILDILSFLSDIDFASKKGLLDANEAFENWCIQQARQ